MLDIDALSKYQIPETEMVLSKRDTMLYALSVGLGSDPVDYDQLKFVCPDGLVALPTMATIIATPYAWIKQANAGFSGKSVHAGVEVKLNGPLPVEGKFRSLNAIVEILDKGPGKAAIATIERRVFHVETGELAFTLLNTNMYRGDGGFGGPSQPAKAPREIPERAPDAIVLMPTLPQQALLYQLNGDYNLLHNDPNTAQRQGFPRPILHGLSTFGIAGHALIKHLCGYDPSKVTAIGTNFTRPVYPGEELAVRVWKHDSMALFQVTVPARGDEVVLDRAFIEFSS